MKILYAAFEATPFMKTGGLGDVAGSLPRALLSAGVDARLIMPKFDTIPDEYKSRMTHVADFYMNLSWRHQYCGIETLTLDGVVCYFIDNEYYFKRPQPYGYYDDGERIAFFAKAVLDCIPHLPDFVPDIIHCNDWHTALTPVYLKNRSRTGVYQNIKTVFTIHNLKFQGLFSRACTGDVLGLSDEEAEHAGLFCSEGLNYLKGGVCCSDALTTVSPSYADEICTAFYGEKLDDVFRGRRHLLHGILNGIDTSVYDPQSDPMIAAHYSVDDISGKAANKAALQKRLGLKKRARTPLLAVVSRLTEQKGFDLVLHIMRELMQESVQLVVLGVGDEKYERAFRQLAEEMPDKVSANICFDDALSHLIYAGADMVLVPSLFEPCGLSQMFAMRYGALPVVRETGGLRDSVEPYNKYEHTGTGFSFANYNAHELLFTLKDAMTLYHRRRAEWEAMVLRAMNKDFSWGASAKQYMDLYTELLK